MREQDNKIIQSTKWSAVSEVLVKIASPLINIILARLLTPEVFGLVATFTLVTSFAEVFTDSGFQKYLVQHEFIDEDDREKTTNVAFWTNMFLSVLFWGVIFIFRNQIAIFVGSEGYGLEIAVLSLQIPIYCFSSMQTALYRRDFKFKQLVPIRFIVSIIPLLITIPLAIIYRNCWAIIIGTLAKESVNAILLTIRSSWKPKLYYNFEKLHAMLKDCLWLMADSFMIWVTSYAGTLIVSRRLSDYYLGIYKAGSTAVTPYLSLVFTITSPVLFSALSRIQNNKNECNRVFLNYQKYASYLVLPMGALIFSYKELVTLILLGSNWSEAALLVGCVGISLPVCIVTAQYNSIYFRALGKPYVALAVQSAYAVVMVIVLLLASKQSFVILSVVSGVINLAYTAISVIALRIVFRGSFSEFVKGGLPAIIGSAAIVAISELLKNAFLLSIWWQLGFAIISVLAYLIVIFAIPQSRKTILELEMWNKVTLKLKREM